MIHALATAFSEMANPTVVLLFLVGTLAGFAIGLLPGIGSIVAISLLLPFTFHMTSFEAFALLLSLYAVVTTAGDLTSILVGIPAHPECAAMILDGYPMARKGQAGRAMAAAVYSSTIGAVIGALVLAASIPIMQKIVLYIGSGELFMLAILGVIMVGAVSGDYPLQGAVMGGIGLLLAAVGPDVQTGIIRFGFHSAYLVGGIPLVPLAVGLFGVPQLFEMHARRKQTLGKKMEISDSGLRSGLVDTFTHWGVVVRGSIVGVVVGAAPGLGSALGQWVAYGQAVQTSKTPERFGKGAVEGVLAPGASTHAKEGGALIPTLAFGVPGSGAMAVLLGAFLILGLDPGPSMLSQHLDVTYFMVIVLVAASILGSALCLALLRPLAAVTRLRASFLVPVVMFLIFIGAAATSGQIGDLYVMLAAGMLAWFLTHQRWPIVPVVLGYVLGKSAEPNLFIAQRSYGWAFLERPLVIALIVISALTIVWSVRLQRRQRAMRPKLGGGADSAADRGTSWPSLVIAVLMTALSVFAVVHSRPWPRDARLYPTIIGTATAALGALCILQWVHARRRRRAILGAAPSIATVTTPATVGAPPAQVATPDQGAAAAYRSADRDVFMPNASGGEDSAAASPGTADAGDAGDSGAGDAASQEMPASASVRRELPMLIWLAGMALASWLFGLGVAGVIFALVYLIAACREKLRVVIPIAVGVWLLYEIVFVKLLAITLPIPTIHLL